MCTMNARVYITLVLPRAQLGRGYCKYMWDLCLSLFINTLGGQSARSHVPFPGCCKFNHVVVIPEMDVPLEQPCKEGAWSIHAGAKFCGVSIKSTLLEKTQELELQNYHNTQLKIPKRMFFICGCMLPTTRTPRSSLVSLSIHLNFLLLGFWMFLTLMIDGDRNVPIVLEGQRK